MPLLLNDMLVVCAAIANSDETALSIPGPHEELSLAFHLGMMHKRKR